MLCLAYIHKDADSAYGITFPDFPGCFSSADELSAIPYAAQEAVEVHFEGEDFLVPSPSVPEDWAQDDRFEGGYWMLLELDMSKVKMKSIRVNVSLSEQSVQQIDDYAKARHMSRSAFLAAAAKHEMARGNGIH